MAFVYVHTQIKINYMWIRANNNISDDSITFLAKLDLPTHNCISTDNDTQAHQHALQP